MQRGIHQLINREFHIRCGEWHPVREMKPLAKLKGDGSSVSRDLPRHSQFRFHLLGLTVQTQQHSSRQIADSFRGIIGHQRRVECLRFGAQEELQLIEANTGVRQEAEQQKEAKA